jgi:hypothetical protein
MLGLQPSKSIRRTASPGVDNLLVAVQSHQPLQVVYVSRRQIDFGHHRGAGAADPHHFKLSLRDLGRCLSVAGAVADQRVDQPGGLLR